MYSEPRVKLRISLLYKLKIALSGYLHCTYVCGRIVIFAYFKAMLAHKGEGVIVCAHMLCEMDPVTCQFVFMFPRDVP